MIWKQAGPPAPIVIFPYHLFNGDLIFPFRSYLILGHDQLPSDRGSLRRRRNGYSGKFLLKGQLHHSPLFPKHFLRKKIYLSVDRRLFPKGKAGAAAALLSHSVYQFRRHGRTFRPYQKFLKGQLLKGFLIMDPAAQPVGRLTGPFRLLPGGHVGGLYKDQLGSLKEHLGKWNLLAPGQIEKLCLRPVRQCLKDPGASRLPLSFVKSQVDPSTGLHRKDPGVPHVKYVLLKVWCFFHKERKPAAGTSLPFLDLCQSPVIIKSDIIVLIAAFKHCLQRVWSDKYILLCFHGDLFSVFIRNVGLKGSTCRKARTCPGVVCQAKYCISAGWDGGFHGGIETVKKICPELLRKRPVFPLCGILQSSVHLGQGGADIRVLSVHMPFRRVSRRPFFYLIHDLPKRSRSSFLFHEIPSFLFGYNSIPSLR